MHRCQRRQTWSRSSADWDTSASSSAVVTRSRTVESRSSKGPTRGPRSSSAGTPTAETDPWARAIGLRTVPCRGNRAAGSPRNWAAIPATRLAAASAATGCRVSKRTSAARRWGRRDSDTSADTDSATDRYDDSRSDSTTIPIARGSSSADRRSRAASRWASSTPSDAQIRSPTTIP